MAYDNKNSGALFENTRKREGKNDPDRAGQINIDGKDYWLSGWLKKDKEGKTYLSLSVKPKTGSAGGSNDKF